jgi:hypothetical protein
MISPKARVVAGAAAVLAAAAMTACGSQNAKESPSSGGPALPTESVATSPVDATSGPLPAQEQGPTSTTRPPDESAAPGVTAPGPANPNQDGIGGPVHGSNGPGGNTGGTGNNSGNG